MNVSVSGVLDGAPQTRSVLISMGIAGKAGASGADNGKNADPEAVISLPAVESR